MFAIYLNGERVVIVPAGYTFQDCLNFCKNMNILYRKKCQVIILL